MKLAFLDIRHFLRSTAVLPQMTDASFYILRSPEVPWHHTISVRLVGNFFDYLGQF